MENIEQTIYKKGDVVQIINEDHKWYPCLLIVDEVKPWGVMAYALVPGESGVAFNRLLYSDIVYIGDAEVMIAEKEE